MSNPIVYIAVISLFTFSAIFCLVGFIRYKAARLTEKNCIETTAVLVAFRDFRIGSERPDRVYSDMRENGMNRYPVMAFEENGRMLLVAAAISDYDLTSEDIGREFKVRYKHGFGITLLVDDEMSIKNYNQLQNTLFWVFESLAIILALFAVAAYKLLPLIFNRIL